eukprot:gene48951-6200_t
MRYTPKALLNWVVKCGIALVFALHVYDCLRLAWCTLHDPRDTLWGIWDLLGPAVVLAVALELAQALVRMCDVAGPVVRAASSAVSRRWKCT